MRMDPYKLQENKWKKKIRKKKNNNKGRDYEKMQFLINGDMQNNKNTLFVIVWSLFLQNNF